MKKSWARGGVPGRECVPQPAQLRAMVSQASYVWTLPVYFRIKNLAKNLNALNATGTSTKKKNRKKNMEKTKEANEQQRLVCYSFLIQSLLKTYQKYHQNTPKSPPNTPTNAPKTRPKINNYSWPKNVQVQWAKDYNVQVYKSVIKKQIPI